MNSFLGTSLQLYLYFDRCDIQCEYTFRAQLLLIYWYLIHLISVLIIYDISIEDLLLIHNTYTLYSKLLWAVNLKSICPFPLYSNINQRWYFYKRKLNALKGIVSTNINNNKTPILPLIFWLKYLYTCIIFKKTHLISTHNLCKAKGIKSSILFCTFS